MKILSVNVGKPADLPYGKKVVQSGIQKAPVHQAIFLSKTGFEGDGQADLVHHGGEDKAVCVYPHEHYTYWAKTLGRPLPQAAFGENITAAGLLETDVYIGDIFQLGEAVVQISQPRQPCFKLAARYNEPTLVSRVDETGYTGFYFRVLTEGKVGAESRLERIHIHPAAITVEEANQIMKKKESSQEKIKKLVDLEELAESWKKPLLKRLHTS
ncbi:MOSC domain-containing protein [Domibacillus indicus]|uniref:MOSC domain-containing protein n=1 Tax=Domibacillus indicus TaxID=1437523 RepID=UPI00203E78D7|nr:MOSC domain-containing protein [Domibacillus indicus]MCM3788057.1 MOSC domain-containing protein [Domibacillus indicus]